MIGQPGCRNDCAISPYGECACRSSGQGHGQADQRTGRGRAAQLMGVSLGFPKGCGSPVATSKCSTLHEVHQLLHNSFLLAVEWGILIKSPVPVEAPKKTTQERSIWEVDEMRAALDSMEDPILHLTLVGALREGEVAGCPPGVPAHRLSWAASLQCHLPVDDLRR